MHCCMSPILLQIFSVLHGAPQCYQNSDGSPRFLVCTEADKARYFRAFDFQSGSEKDAALLELLSASAK